jgi:hypothetical protein
VSESKNSDALLVFKQPSPPVIPALRQAQGRLACGQAGTQRLSLLRGVTGEQSHWIPAFAGMTGREGIA